ncbi:MAG: hypothetical protein H6557_06845 [Lewinellaceae bacterium]|nr:hypothetical protein [Phaeodactylibacter sp.]MCB9036319.1 hypothetical protein [Lewinellaceae bacterium]
MNELYRHITRLAFLLLLLLPGGVLSAQVGSKPRLRPAPTQQDTLKKNKVDVDHADVFEYIQRKDTVLQKLNGNVELRQDSIYMYCDTAVIKNNTHVTATGNVIIQQGDSTSTFADSAMYDGILRMAELYGDVILVNGEQKLFTDRLTYDLAQKLATYSNGATLTLDSTQLTSKRGYYYVREKQIYFKDSVIVVNPEFHLRSDTLGFNTESKVVSFLGPTLISTDSSRIYTEDGYYDTENNLAAFTQNAQYRKGEQMATADTIRYDGKRSLYSLEGNAVFEEGERRATANLIRYDEANDKTFLSGNARYRDEKQDIVADEITYDAKRETYSTRGRSVISDPPQILTADQVDYIEEKGLGIAQGNVIWRDTAAKLTIVCELAEYDRKTDYLKASGGRGGRPLLITIIEGDSLFMASDTLMAIRESPAPARKDAAVAGRDSMAVQQYPLPVREDTLAASGDSLAIREGPVAAGLDSVATQQYPLSVREDSLTVAGDSAAIGEGRVAARQDSIAVPADSVAVRVDPTAVQEAPKAGDPPRQLLAYYDVRIYKSDMQAVCDSLSYKASDSTFYFFPLRQKPIVWSDTSQFTADTVMMVLADDKIDKIFMRNNGFIINSPDELFFNQVKGKNVTAFFEENELRRMAVVGNAESVYYARDDKDGYVGVNKTICSEMLLYFGDNQVDKIKFFTEPKAEMKPMQQADHNALKMPGFFWEKERRPMSLADLFDPAKAPLSPKAPPKAPPAKEQAAPAAEEVTPPVLVPESLEQVGEKGK